MFLGENMPDDGPAPLPSTLDQTEESLSELLLKEATSEQERQEIIEIFNVNLEFA